MALSRKDFVAAAGIISDIQDYDERVTAAKAFAAYFAGTNPNFNRTRFLDAAGVERKDQ